MKSLFTVLILITLVVSPALAQTYTLNAFLKHDGDIKGVAFSEDGRTLASMGTDRVLHYWNPHTEKRQPHAEISAIDRWSIDASVVPEEPHRLPVNTFDTLRQTVAFPGVEDPSGLLASGSSDKTIWLQGFPTLRPLFQIQEQGKVWAVALSPDGQTLASGGDFAGIHLWDLNTISPVHGTIELKSTFAASTARVEGLAFSPDGQTLAVATGKSDGEAIHLWDLRTEQLKETLIAVGVPIRKVAFSPDGQIIAAGARHTFGGRNVLLWKRGPLSPAKIPHSVELVGPPTVRTLAEDFTYTVTVKNVYGHGIENILVKLDNPLTGVWRHNQLNGAWTDNQGNAVFFLQFRAVGMHDVNVKVLHRASRAVTLEKLFERRVEVPKPASITPVEATLDYSLICDDIIESYEDAFIVKDATNQTLAGFRMEIKAFGLPSKIVFSETEHTDSQGIAKFEILLIAGTYDVEAEVYDLITPTLWLDATFSNRITLIQHKTINQYGATVYTQRDGNTTTLIKGLELVGAGSCEEDYTKYFPSHNGKYFRISDQGKTNYCGVHASMMLLSYYGAKVSRSQYMVMADIYTFPVTPSEMVKGINSILPTTDVKRIDDTHAGYPRLQSLRDKISQNLPTIILTRLGSISYHYVVVVGFDTKKNMFLIADPNNYFIWQYWDRDTLISEHSSTGIGGDKYYRPQLDLSWGLHGFEPYKYSRNENDYKVSNETVEWLLELKGPFDFTDEVYAYTMFVPEDPAINGLVPEDPSTVAPLKSKSVWVKVYGDIRPKPLCLSDWDSWRREYSFDGEVEYVWFGKRKKAFIPGLKGLRITPYRANANTPQVDGNRVVLSGEISAGLTAICHGSIEGVLTVYYDSSSAAAPPVTLPVTLSPISVETALLPNYPNPFNPETWVPYQLAESGDVTLTIYSVEGKLIRTLELGHQDTGVYHSKARAAYWDGRNELGERVASGLYFYTLTAGDFSATSKMLIMK